MDIGFIDLDILLTRIRNHRSKTYLLDAVKAYKAGALRGALTSAWVALVYDLIAKYRELSAMGDASATAYIQSWDNATNSNDIPRLLQLEANILDDATNNTQVVSHTARTHLVRLREDRHLCAHPAFSAEADLFEPTPELVRLHLVNAVNLVLAQEPLQGRAIFDLFDADVQTQGFPIAHDRILDYVQQRYLTQIRAQSVHNFGIVLAKSLLKGVPAQWEPLQRKITSSLVAVRDRAVHAWPDIFQAVVRLVDNLEPRNRHRAIAFVAAFPDFWQHLQEPTRTALQQTIENTTPATLTNYDVLKGSAVPQLRGAVTALIAGLSRQQLTDAIATSPLPELWPAAINIYRESASFRGSEANFLLYIAPFSGRLVQSQIDLLFDAVVANSQNWDAGDTDTLILGVLRNTALSNYPTIDARNRFYQFIRRVHRTDSYQEVFNLLQSDGWAVPQPEQDEEEL